MGPSKCATSKGLFIWTNVGKMCEEGENAEFYIADAKGIPVWHKDKIEVDMESSGKKLKRVDTASIFN